MYFIFLFFSLHSTCSAGRTRGAPMPAGGQGDNVGTGFGSPSLRSPRSSPAGASNVTSAIPGLEFSFAAVTEPVPLLIVRCTEKPLENRCLIYVYFCKMLPINFCVLKASRVPSASRIAPAAPACPSAFTRLWRGLRTVLEPAACTNANPGRGKNSPLQLVSSLESWNPRIIKVGKDLKDYLVQPPPTTTTP